MNNCVENENSVPEQQQPKNDKSFNDDNHWSSDDYITDTSDDSSDDDSELSFNETFSNDKKDHRIMFAASNLSVSDVMLMLQAINIRFNKTREEQNTLLKLVKVLAGPSFDTLSYSPYKLTKAVAPPKETMKKQYYCPTCNCIITEMFLSEKKKFSKVCEICQKKFLISPANSNYFISLSVRYQLKKLFSRKDIQQSIFNWEKEVSTSKMNFITDITDSILYKENIKSSDTISFNFSTDGAQLFNSAKKALWPLQLHLNCLSGTSRFKYPIIMALWQTEQEPTPQFMDLYMSVLINECREVSENGIEIIDYKTGKKYIKKLVPFLLLR